MNLPKNSTMTVLVVAFLLLGSTFAFLPVFAASGNGTGAVNSSQPAASNASPPTVVGTPNVVVGTTATGFSVKVTNPTTNAYAITSITIVSPSSSWTFSGTPTCGTNLGTVGATSSSAVQCTAGSGSGIPPGFSDTLNLGLVTGPNSVATSAAIIGTFSTLVVDSGSAASYSGSTFPVYSIATPGTISVTTSPTTTAFTAGGSPYTVTATLASGQFGVPIVWSFSNNAYPSSTCTSTSTLSPTSGTTGTGGVATTSFAPSNCATDATGITATLGTNTGYTGTSNSIVTVPGAPTQVSIKFQTGSPLKTYSTDYLSGAAAEVTIGTTHYATTGSEVSLALADQFGNGIALSSVTNISISAVGGSFNVGGTLYSAIACGTQSYQIPTGTCSSSATSISFPIASNSAGSINFVQSATYGTVGEMSAVITAGAHTYTGVSGQIITSTFSGSLNAPLQYVNNVPANTPVAAGKSANITEQLPIAQAGVPVTLNICLTCVGTSTGYTASFSANGQTSITVATNANGFVSALMPVDTVSGSVVVFNATALAPITTATTTKLSSGVSAGVTTTNGAIASLVVNIAANPSPNAGPNLKYATNGTTAYVDVAYSDAYGNLIPLASAPSNQIQIGLTASAGLLSATSVYIASGQVSTNGTGVTSSFGSIQWTLPNAVGATENLTATGVVSGVSVKGVASVALVSPQPTLSVTQPTQVSGVAYANTPLVSFSGQANVSLGLLTNTVTSVGYKVGSGGWHSISIAAQANVPWSALIALQPGLNTVTFNATDNQNNVVVSAPMTVLVDTSGPQFGNMSVSGTSVVVNATSTMGDLNASSVSATVNGTAVAASSISVTGTNNAGSSVTYTISVSGLSTGTWVVTVSAMDLAGNSGTTTGTVTVTVVPPPVGSTFAFASAPTQVSSTLGPAVSATITNNGGSAYTAYVYVVVHSASGATVYIGAANFGSVAPGSSSSLTIPIILSPGTYTASVQVYTPAGVTVSAPATVTITVS